jgi:molecular chaperone HtpG
MGDETFSLTSADKSTRGTTIEIKLKDDATEFAEEYRLREIIRKHPDYVAFPIYIGDEEEQINRQTAIWRQSPQSIEENEYEDFFKQLTLDMEPPLAQTHVITDAPIQLYALLYIPSKGERGILSLRREDGLKLYSRKVLIQDYNKDLLPEYYRFIQGVVDSEDLPLNVSREMIQSSALMNRLKKILTGRVTNLLSDLANDKEHPEKYIVFWENFGVFIKEGVATDLTDREALYPLLRFHTTKFTDQWVSLNEYVGRMKASQKKIYYLLGDDPRSVTRSPHLDYFSTHGYEVILLTDTIDSFMLLGLQKFEGFDFQNVATPDQELPPPDNDKTEQESKAISDQEFNSLIERFKKHLGDKVTDVRATDRLSGSIARLVDPEGALNQEMQRVYKLMERDFETPKKVLELNPRHPTLAKLSELPEDEALGQVVIDQIYESALLIEGLHPDPASMIPRVERLIAAALN